jgi:hypothetical protein
MLEEMTRKVPYSSVLADMQKRKELTNVLYVV